MFATNAQYHPVSSARRADRSGADGASRHDVERPDVHL